MALALMAKAITLNDGTPIINSQRSSSNPSNMQIAQPGMNMDQDRRMLMVEDNVEKTRSEECNMQNVGIRCYNLQRMEDHYAANCTVKATEIGCAFEELREANAICCLENNYARKSIESRSQMTMLPFKTQTVQLIGIGKLRCGSKERFASPKPSKPRSCLRWSPTGRFFDLKGKIITSSESESQSDCSKGDNACTSNPQEPIRKRFPSSTFSMTGCQNWFDTLLIPLLSEYKSPQGKHLYGRGQ
ncbi:hypothetical protein Tco_1202414 [Tanacetum coccineum]